MAEGLSPRTNPGSAAKYQVSATKDHSADWTKKASWTVVHAKRKHSQMSFLSAGEDPSIADQIKEMGKDLCKTRPDDPKCKQFQDKPEEEEKEEEAKAKETEAPTPAP